MIRSLSTHPAAVRQNVAYEIGENVYRLKDHNLVVIDEKNNTALIIEAPEPQQREEQ